MNHGGDYVAHRTDQGPVAGDRDGLQLRAIGRQRLADHLAGPRVEEPDEPVLGSRHDEVGLRQGHDVRQVDPLGHGTSRRTASVSGVDDAVRQDHGRVTATVIALEPGTPARRRAVTWRRSTCWGADTTSGCRRPLTRCS